MPDLSRRSFLKATAWIAGGITIAFSARLIKEKSVSVGPTLEFPNAESGKGWLQVRSDGKVHMLCPRMEMGQNANTGLAQIVAEELNIRVQDITLHYPTTSETAPIGFTAGSLSMMLFSKPVAIAAASMRENLRCRAAKINKISVDEVIDTEGGFVILGSPRIGYQDLVTDESIELDFENSVIPTLYTFDPRRIKKQVGQEAEPRGIKDLVTGAPVFSGDIQLPGMLYGRVIKPPVRKARLKKLNFSTVQNIIGFFDIVRDGDFVGVVCRTPGSLDKVVRSVIIEWELPEPINQEKINQLLDINVALQRGDLPSTLQDENHNPIANWDVDLEFAVQLQTHAMQEPRAAVAHIEKINDIERINIWTGTQDPWAIKRHCADDIGFREDQVEVHPMRMGGGFGGREHYEVEQDAARLALATGLPIKVQWTREDEFRVARNRSPSSHRMRLACDHKGVLSNWWHAYASGYVFYSRSRLPDWLLPFKRSTAGGDFGVSRGAHPAYKSPSIRVEYKEVDLPIDLGVWRSLNGAPNTFVIESTMDELARQKSIDPVRFKLMNIPDSMARLGNCLKRVETMANRKSLPTKSGYGRGFACGVYEKNSFVAVSVDLHIDHEARKICIDRMCCAQDVGMAINPDQLRAQIESNLVWSIGMALMEKVEIGDGQIASNNFHNYMIPRMSDIPSLDIDIIDNPAIHPSGAGEVALIAGSPAIANAIRDATGLRLTRLPIKYTDITALGSL
jgi:isoquinoline 1-oxidoreductase beta subunit